MKFRSEIIHVDGNPNKNGRIYTAETVESILKTWKEHKYIVFGFSENDEEIIIKPSEICGQIDNLWLEGDSVMAEGHMLDEHIGTKVLKELNEVDLGMYISINGIGAYENDNKTVKDYELKYFSLTNESAFCVDKIKLL